MRISESQRLGAGTQPPSRRRFGVYLALAGTTAHHSCGARCQQGAGCNRIGPWSRQWSSLRGRFLYAHPAFHTMVNWLVTRVWLSPAGIVGLQILALAGAAGWGLALGVRMGATRGLTLVAAFICGIAPMNGLIVITLWKDLLHTASLAGRISDCAASYQRFDHAEFGYGLRLPLSCVADRLASRSMATSHLHLCGPLGHWSVGLAGAQSRTLSARRPLPSRTLIHYPGQQRIHRSDALRTCEIVHAESRPPSPRRVNLFRKAA